MKHLAFSPALSFVVLLLVATESQAQWVQAGGLVGGDVNSLIMIGTNLFAATDSGGIYLSTDNGTSWTSANSGLEGKTIVTFAVNGTNIFAGGSAGGNTGGVFLSTNTGTAWTALDFPNFYVHSFAMIGTNIFAGTLKNNGIFLSTDNGTSWTPIAAIPSDADLYSLAAIGSNLFAGTNGGGVFLSTDNGTSWGAVNTGLINTDVFTLAAIDTNLFEGNQNSNGTDPGGIYVFTNNGASWSAANSGLTSTFVTSIVASPAGGGTKLFAGTYYAGGIFLSTNSGSSWTAFNTGLTNLTVLSLTVSSTYLFAGTNGSGVWRRPLSDALPVELISFTAECFSNNVNLKWSTVTEVNNFGFEIERAINNNELGIKDWKKIGFVEGSGTSNAAKNYSFIDKDLSAGTYSYQLKQIDRGGQFKYSQSVQVEITAPSILKLSENFPNPFNPTTTISYALPTRANVSLRIFNLLGQEIATLENGQKEAGNYSVEWNALKVSSGVYFYQLDAGGLLQTKKLLLLK